MAEPHVSEASAGSKEVTVDAPVDGVTRIVVLGGGFGGVYTARHLERHFRGDRSVRISLVSRNNYFLMTPLLFEAGSGVLEPRHAVNPIRPLLHKARFIEAEVKRIDLDRRIVEAAPAKGETYAIGYEHLVLAMGGIVNTSIIPGAEFARTFKTLADAIALRNHVIETFERADVEPNPVEKKALLTFVIIGGGLVGVELVGELTEFIGAVADLYRHVDRAEIQFYLIEGGPHLVPEFDRDLADYAQGVLERRGVRVRTSTKVKSIERGRVHVPGPSESEPLETIAAETIIASTGVVPSPLVAALPLDKDKRGRIHTEPTMRSRSRPEVWALGDCASIPDPNGKPYPPLAQHALREARVLADNIAAAVRDGEKAQLKPFVYNTKGTLAALGHFKGVGRIYKLKIYGFFAWWVWRSYYLMQMPQWSRRLRIVIDWTIALLFKNDVVELDLDPERQRR